MKLYEAIKNLPDNDWVDISEIKKNHLLHIGRITKELLRGEILGREIVKSLSDEGTGGGNIHHFYIEARKNEIHKFD